MNKVELTKAEFESAKYMNEVDPKQFWELAMLPKNELKFLHTNSDNEIVKRIIEVVRSCKENSEPLRIIKRQSELRQTINRY